MANSEDLILKFLIDEALVRQGMSLAERLERRLASAGYVPVLHLQKDSQPECPQGFFLMEYRRLDDPRYCAITSLNPHSTGDEALQVTFDKVLLKYDLNLKGLVNAFKFRAGASAPVTITAQQAVASQGDKHLPYGNSPALRYRVLAYTLQNRMPITFFVDPHKIGHDYVTLSARAESGVYNTPVQSSVAGKFLATRRVFLSVPTNIDKRRLALHIKAENIQYFYGRKVTVPQRVSLRQFSQFHEEIVGHHVRGGAHACYAAAPDFHRF